MVEQYPFDLSPDPVFSFENFVEGQSNFVALKSVRAYPDWPAPIFIVFGPKGCGKTHLGTAWKSENPKVVFQDDCLRMSEDELFAVTNAALNGDTPGLLLAAREHPDLWSVKLPDLRSRLNYIPKLEMGEPDEDILGPIIRKLFEDRGRTVKSNIVSHIVGRYERSVPAVSELVQRLDFAASQEKKDLTQNFVASYLKRAGH